jgi:hypothetical protein
MVRIPSITADRIKVVRWCSISGWERLQVYFAAHQTVHYSDVLIRSYAHFSNCCQKLKTHANQPRNPLEHVHAAIYSKLNYIYLVLDNEKTDLIFIEFRIHKLVVFCLCVTLERLATFVLSIPEGVVERRTAVHPVRAFTSIGRDCVGCFVDTWKGDCLGNSSRGQPRGALPLH